MNEWMNEWMKKSATRKSATWTSRGGWWDEPCPEDTRFKIPVSGEQTLYFFKTWQLSEHKLFVQHAYFDVGPTSVYKCLVFTGRQSALTATPGPRPDIVVKLNNHFVSADDVSDGLYKQPSQNIQRKMFATAACQRQKFLPSVVPV